MDFDLLVVANPVWETTWLVDSLPSGREPGSGALPAEAACADGGGSSLNTACALSAAGRRVLAVGRVGDDAEGLAAVAALKKRGVLTEIEVVPGRTTKRNHVYVERDSAAVAFEVDLPPKSVQPWEETPPRLMEAKLLWLDRLAAAAPAWLEARKRAVGRMNGLNRNSGIGTAAIEERFRRALPWIDYLQMPEREPENVQAPLRRAGAERAREVVQVPGAPAEVPEVIQAFDRGRIHRPAPLPRLSEPQVEELFAAGLGVLIRTRGARGVALDQSASSAMAARDRRLRPETIEIPSRSTPVVDPTGAGDAFSAGFLDALLDGMSPADCARRGVDWAARACRHPGARGWLDAEPPRG